MADQLVPQFIQLIGNAFVSGSADNLLAVVPLGPDHSYWAPLQQALSYANASISTIPAILPLVQVIPPASRETFASFVGAVLDNARPERNLASTSQDARGTAGGIAYRSFTRLMAVYTEANRLYAMSSNGPYLHPFLNLLILNLARRLVPLSKRAAAQASAPSRDPASARSIKDATRQTIERSLQVAASPIQSAEWEIEAGKEWFVGDIVWALGNILWRIYAERRLHNQAAEVRRVIDGLTPHAEKRLAVRGTRVRQVDVCESWYWRGRLEVILLDIRVAKHSLERAWRLCPEGAWQQQRAILIRLIPINLLHGILPHPAVLQQYHLPEFANLIAAYKHGDVAAWRAELEGKKRDWFRRRSVWLILYERGEILVWRNLFQRALRTYYRLNPQAQPTRCPTWIFISAASSVFARHHPEHKTHLEDIISVISSLIDQSLIRGHLSYSQQTLVTKASEDGMGGFPRVSTVTPRTIVANA